MQNASMSTYIVWCLVGIAVLLCLSIVILRGGWRKGYHAKRGAQSATTVDGLLNAHIATQWTEGRVRLGFLLALMKELRASLEQDVETLGRLDPSGAEYEHEARGTVAHNIRRFTFDEHLREECRVLVPFLQFCGHDLAEQGRNTTEQLKALEEVLAVIGSIHSH